MRRVLVVSHEATRTGAPRVAVELVKAFRSNGWDTTVVLRWGGPLAPDLRTAAHRAVDEPASRLRALLRRRRSTKRFVVRLERWAASRVVRSTRPDLIWCNTVISVPYAVAATGSEVPVVVHSHEQESLVRGVFDRWGLPELLAAAGRQPVLVGCAPETSEVLAAVAGVDPQSVWTLRSPVDVASVRRAGSPHSTTPGQRTVVACATADRRKGVDVFVAAAEASVSRGDRVDWVWVGRNDEGVASPAVRFVGEVSDPLRWIASADVFVLPSRAEAFPLVVLEAMALGRPVVASDLAGPAEQLGDTGVLVPVEDPVTLLEAVSALLEDPAAATALGRSASQRCEQRWDVLAFADEVQRIAEAACA